MRSILVLVAAMPSCIGVSARARVGVITDARGTDAQAGIVLGFGYSGERSAVIASGGVVAGTAPKLGVVDELDYVRLPEQLGGIGWRAGIGGWLGEPSFVGAHLATLFVVRDRFHRDSSEKGWLPEDSTRTTMAVGLEGGVGEAMFGDSTHSIAGTAAATFELISLSSWK